MNQNFAAMILGGTGQVGSAAAAELLAIPECREVVMVTRKPIAARSRVRNVVLDTGAADFAERSQCTGARKSCNDLNSASWVPLRVAVTMPESPGFAYFLRQEAQPAAGFGMSASWA
jgi:uncharacterized protein YbjT (DUF2867 family)